MKDMTANSGDDALTLQQLRADQTNNIHCKFTTNVGF